MRAQLGWRLAATALCLCVLAAVMQPAASAVAPPRGAIAVTAAALQPKPKTQQQQLQQQQQQQQQRTGSSSSGAVLGFGGQYKKEIRPLLARSFSIAHKEIFFLALRIILQSSVTLRNPNDLFLSAVAMLAKFLLDIAFQFLSIMQFRPLINNEFGAPRVPERVALAWRSRFWGFIAIRGVQRLAFLAAFQSLYSLMSNCSKLVAEYLHLYPGSEGTFDTFGWEISSVVSFTFCYSLVGIMLFKYLWGQALRLTIADKVYLWGLGANGEVKQSASASAVPVTVSQALRASPSLVDALDASHIVSRLLVLYIVPRLLAGCITLYPHPFLAYWDVLFMVASHLLFLDRILPPPGAKK